MIKHTHTQATLLSKKEVQQIHLEPEKKSGNRCYRKKVVSCKQQPNKEIHNRTLTLNETNKQKQNNPSKK